MPTEIGTSAAGLVRRAGKASTAQLAAMQEHLAQLERPGVEAIED